MTSTDAPLTAEALKQVREMLTVPVHGYPDKNVVLLMGTARALLATRDAERARAEAVVEALEEWWRLWDAPGDGPLNSVPGDMRERHRVALGAYREGQG